MEGNTKAEVFPPSKQKQQSYRRGDEIEKAEIMSTFLGKLFQEELLRKSCYGERHDPQCNGWTSGNVGRDIICI